MWFHPFVFTEITEYRDEEGHLWVKEAKRPSISLLQYHCAWRTRTNHFLRYSDVKAKGAYREMQ